MSNFQVKCPHCGNFYDGDQVKCPHCTFSNNKDATSDLSEQKDRTKFQHSDELIWSGKPCWSYYIAYWIIGILTLYIGIGLIFIVYAILDQKMKEFILTTRKVVSKKGIISRKIDEIALRDIRSTSMIQSIPGRIFGFGTIRIGSAGTAGVEVEFIGIKNAEHIMGQIRELIESRNDSE